MLSNPVLTGRGGKAVGVRLRAGTLTLGYSYQPCAGTGSCAGFGPESTGIIMGPYGILDNSWGAVQALDVDDDGEITCGGHAVEFDGAKECKILAGDRSANYPVSFTGESPVINNASCADKVVLEFCPDKYDPGTGALLCTFGDRNETYSWCYERNGSPFQARGFVSGEDPAIKSSSNLGCLFLGDIIKDYFGSRTSLCSTKTGLCVRLKDVPVFTVMAAPAADTTSILGGNRVNVTTVASEVDEGCDYVLHVSEKCKVRNVKSEDWSEYGPGSNLLVKSGDSYVFCYETESGDLVYSSWTIV